eukprot:GGOE01002999.1.p1 GENE.GGOE01002999.1~~GGOE01002999.1.p1  ORF type:complete len:290 (+),score=77.80 GGOE01002999.1:38-871(+)
MAAEFEDEFVRQPYDAIAEHWDHTRFLPWPFCARFVADLPKDALVIEVGCGNGRNLQRQDIFMHGCDNSLELLCRAAAHRGADVALADNLALPYRSGSWDVVLSIAVLHHFSTPERRLRAVQELFRILRGGRQGRLLLYVRSQERQEMIAKGTKLLNGCPEELLIPWNHNQKYHYTRAGRSPIVDAAKPWSGAPAAAEAAAQNAAPPPPALTPDASTVVLPSTRGEGEHAEEPQLHYRYHHLFTEAELRGLLQRVEGARVLQWTQEKDNWVVVACRD